ncbi:type I polyketide synthase [Eleftheria terrae]|uniref:type I polyketide synthase n=1 Tax=Eleftheria terrae TaxID=1597781 RepID=UPI00263A76C3|nr:type I polyketide synthase [Eleftheria terrae]WKB55889.1 AMP-binding protein [Eleftheria terrae]
MSRIRSVAAGSLNSRIKFIAFPFAGGGEQSYQILAERLQKDFAFITLALPGRGQQHDIEPYSDWSALVFDLAQEVIQQAAGSPFVLFGHSFGALLAFEVVRALRQCGAPMPLGLILSACPAPQLPRPRSEPGRQTHTLPGTAFLDAVREWGFFNSHWLGPSTPAVQDALLRHAEAALRADLRLDETYRFAPGAPLALPAVVMGGTQDHSVAPQALQAWQDQFATPLACTVERFDGGHFYFLQDDATADALASRLALHGEHWLRDRPASLRSQAPAPGSLLAAHGWDAAQWRSGQSVLAHICGQVDRTPDTPALVDGERRWSYRELSAAAARLAGSLQAAGVKAGEVLGVFLPHSAEYTLALLGAWACGAVVCLLEKNWSDSLLSEFVASAGVSRVLVLPQDLDRLQALLGPVPCLVVEAGSGHGDTARLQARPCRGEDLAFVSLTSGSTGKPKAVLTTQRGCSYCFLARQDLYPYQAGEREGMNVFFAWECLRPLMFGLAAVIIPDAVIFDPPRLLAFLEQERITRLVVTPSLLETVLDAPGLTDRFADSLLALRTCFLMGEVVPARLVEKAARRLPSTLRLVNAYSTWESLDVAYAELLPPPAGLGDCAPVGHVMPGCTVAVLDEAGRPVPQGVAGELYVASPGLAPGYLGDAAKTAERFLPAPPALASLQVATVYRTGDAARLLPDGQLLVLGRIDSTVKIRGFKVSLHAIEAVLDAVPGVGKSLVLPLEDAASAGQPAGLVAYVVGPDGAPSETVLARLRQQARARLPEYAVPGHVIGLAAFPLRQGESRKLDRAALPRPARDAVAATGGAAPLDAAAPTSLEQQLAALWREVLGVTEVHRDDHFFEQGGSSLAAARLVGLLNDRLGLSLAVLDLYQHSRFGQLLQQLSGNRPAGVAPAATPAASAGGTADRTAIAIVGMAGRFPGAASIEAFWRNLRDGVDSLRRYSRDELLAQGVDGAQLDHPDWVPVGQVVDGADRFDAHFFGIGQREAGLMDPQHRLFLEVAWAALEQAGHAHSDNPYRSRTGVFAACGIDGYLVHHLQGGGLHTPLDPGRLFLTEIGNEKDYIATRVAYQMDLGGPAVTVTSACSSALVAVAQAAQAIASGQCDMAVAGAAALTFPNFGYCYEEGLVGSVDGHVRPFDSRASGTLFGDAVGAVVLKRLDLAQADGDPIWAVLSGWGLSNDGRLKAGYTAPSAEAQSRCISDALRMARLHPAQLSYVECHATATLIGDAIELKGLSDAFAAAPPGPPLRPASCAIGSVKGNIGHANAAAGITGLIKTVLQLHHRELAPTVHFDTLNPKLVPYVEHEGSPFHVQRSRSEWTVADPAVQLPRRAGVSSFGIGGTNAHLILEEAPPPVAAPVVAPGRARPVQLLTLSARSPAALRRQLTELAEHLADASAAELACSAYTLHLAREAHVLRTTVCAPADARAAAQALREQAARLPATLPRAKPGATVAFCFSGQGSQQVGMAGGLYRAEAEGGRFRRHFDAACAALSRHLGVDVASLVMEADERTLQRPLVTQCGLFAVEHALAALLVDYGVRPVAVAGHSIGQYAAAVAAEALTLDDAAALVAARAAATEALDGFPGDDGRRVPGGMLAVRGDEAAILAWLPGQPGLWLAVRNAPGQLVLAGLQPALERARPALAALGAECRPVPVSHPFHTELLQPVADAIGRLAVAGRRPALPMTCNVRGGWLGEEAADTAYWARHVVAPVQWADNVATLLRWQPDVIVEIGPGQVLCRLVGKCLPAGGPAPQLLASLPDDARGADDTLHFSELLGRLWCAGVPLDWAAYHQGEASADGQPLRRRWLPPYPFDPDSHWTRPQASIYVKAAAPAPAVAAVTAAAAAPESPWLVRLQPRPAARLKLYCFPYAGGSSRSLEGWARRAPDWLEVVAVEWPGRNRRAEEALARDEADDLRARQALAAAILADAGSLPVAFCGLSYGGAAATELLCSELAELARSGQVKGLAIVGRAPLLEQPDIAADPQDFLLVPAELQADPLWRELFLPILEADLAADARSARRTAARWQAAGRKPLLALPLQVHGGDDDPAFDWRQAADWGRLSSLPLAGLHAYPGGHDFMMRAESEILARLADWLQPQQATPRGTATVSAAPVYAVHWQPLAPRTPPATASASAWADCPPGREAALLDWLRPRLQAPGDRVALLCRRSDDDVNGARQCTGFATLWQGLMRHGCQGHLCLVLPMDAGSGPLAGAARVAAAEQAALGVQLVHADDHPDLRAGRVDAGWIDRLLAEAAAHADEPQWARRRGRPLAPRLRRHAGPALPDGSLGLSGGHYLVTGGSGGLGAAVIDWLVDHQGVPPQRIVVLQRSERPLRAGLQVRRVDLADAAGLASALDGVAHIEGIFHLAGVLDDGMLEQLDAGRIGPVLAPKQALAGVLAHAGRWETRWVMAFSSTSALLGVPGQASYAAANAWLDQLASWPAADSRPPVFSVQWGSWGEAGMSARSDKALRRALQDGERPLATGSALQALSVLLAGVLGENLPGRQFAVCDVDWARSPWAGQPLVREVLAGPPTQAAAPADAGPLPGGPAGVGAGRAAEAAGTEPVMGFLREHVSRWDEALSLSALGLDSLDLAQLRNGFFKRFGQQVPLSLLATPGLTLGALLRQLREAAGLATSQAP